MSYNENRMIPIADWPLSWITSIVDKIRHIRDLKGDDKCWKDLEELYQLLPEGYEIPERDTEIELERCRQFIESTRDPRIQYCSPQREIERLENENIRLLQWVRDLQNGMTVNCVYCGHSFGPKDSTPPSLSDVLKDHMLICKHHPLSEMKKLVYKSFIEGFVCGTKYLNPSTYCNRPISAAKRAWEHSKAKQQLP
jgi:hypothetical protein